MSQTKVEMFTCAMCKGEFPKSDEEQAQAELEHFFGKVPPKNCDMVCDDCWEKVRPDKN